jgi:hypothetical protein
MPELRQGMADFYENNYVTLNSVTEILPLGSKEVMHISMAFFE